MQQVLLCAVPLRYQWAPARSQLLMLPGQGEELRGRHQQPAEFTKNMGEPGEKNISKSR